MSHEGSIAIYYRFSTRVRSTFPSTSYNNNRYLLPMSYDISYDKTTGHNMNRNPECF